MSQFILVFTSSAGEEACMAAYGAVLDRWPAPYSDCFVPTSYGETHVIVSGQDGKPPLVLMHALFASAAVWHRNVAGLSEHFKVYAVDVIGEANKSRPSRPIWSQEEMAVWFRELLDGMGIGQTDLVGNSYGAFMSAYYAMCMLERIRRRRSTRCFRSTCTSSFPKWFPRCSRSCPAVKRQSGMASSGCMPVCRRTAPGTSCSPS